VASWIAYIGVGILAFSLGGALVAYLDTEYCNKLEGQRFQARFERDQALEENERLNGLLAEITDTKEAV
jgi:hypothetical protein